MHTWIPVTPIMAIVLDMARALRWERWSSVQALRWSMLLYVFYFTGGTSAIYIDG